MIHLSHAYKYIYTRKHLCIIYVCILDELATHAHSEATMGMHKLVRYQTDDFDGNKYNKTMTQHLLRASLTQFYTRHLRMVHDASSS